MKINVDTMYKLVLIFLNNPNNINVLLNISVNIIKTIFEELI